MKSKRLVQTLREGRLNFRHIYIYVGLYRRKKVLSMEDALYGCYYMAIKCSWYHFNCGKRVNYALRKTYEGG